VALGPYVVLVGQVVESRSEGGADSPHFQIRVGAAGTDFRVAVNVLSQGSPSELLYVAVEDFQHPMLEEAAALPARRSTQRPGSKHSESGGDPMPPTGPRVRLLPRQRRARHPHEPGQRRPFRQ
jgi:uncharacterized protein YukJ